MVANFASAVAKWEVPESRHADELTTKWSAGIDREYHEADSREMYYPCLHQRCAQPLWQKQ